jgi:hypothetical protein
MNKSEILMFYEMFDDDDISTECLLAMTADAAGCDINDVVSALAGEHVPDYGKTTTSKKSNKNKKKRRKKA